MEVFYVTDLIFTILMNMSSYHRTQLALINKQWANIIDDIGCNHEPTSIEDKIRQAAYYSYIRAGQYPSDIESAIYIRVNSRPSHYDRDLLPDLLTPDDLTLSIPSFRLQSTILSRTNKLPSLDLVIQSDDPYMIELIFRQAGLSMRAALLYVCDGGCSLSTITYFVNHVDIHRDAINDVRLSLISRRRAIPEILEAVSETCDIDIYEIQRGYLIEDAEQVIKLKPTGTIDIKQAALNRLMAKFLPDHQK